MFRKWGLGIGLVLFFVPLVLQAQSFKKGSWQSKVFGTWKIDSLGFDKNVLPLEDVNSLLKKNPHIRFSSDNIFQISTDSTFYMSDSFLLLESGSRKLVYNKLMFVELKSVSDNKMILTLKLPDFRFGILVTCFLVKITDPLMRPDIIGKWKQAADFIPYDDYSEREPRYKLNFNRDETYRLFYHDTIFTGHWVLDPDKFNISMKISKVLHTSTILMLDRSHLTITSPFNKDSILRFSRNSSDNDDYITGDSITIKMKIDSVAAVAMMNDTSVKASSPGEVPDYFCRKWTAFKKVSKRDSSEPHKSISLLFLKNKTYTIVINNKKIPGTCEINPQNETVIFTSKNKENLGLYYFGQDENSGKTILELTFILPGEQKVSTYLFKQE